MQATTMNYFLAVYYMLIYVVSSFFLFFQKVGKKLGKKFGRKKMRGGVVWGGERGRSIKQDTMSYLS